MKEYTYSSYRRETKADMMYGFVEGDPQRWRESQSSDPEKDNSNLGKRLMECAICMERFRPADTVSPLPCHVNHLFHTGCIRPWLLRNRSCPLCKAELHGVALSDVSGSFMINKSISQQQSGASLLKSKYSTPLRARARSDAVAVSRPDGRQPQSRYH